MEKLLNFSRRRCAFRARLSVFTDVGLGPTSGPLNPIRSIYLIDLSLSPWHTLTPGSVREKETNP